MRPDQARWCLRRLCRIQDWLHFLPLVLLSAGSWPFRATPLIASVVCAAIGLTFAAAVNQLRDEGWDSVPPEVFWAHCGLSRETFRWTLQGLVLLGGGVAFSVNVTTGLAYLVMIASGWAYSAGPRWKRLPVVGTLMNALIFAPLAFFGDGAADPSALAAFTGAFTLLLLQNQLLHEVAHAPADRRDGIRTTAVVFGTGIAKVLSAFLGVAAAVVLVHFGVDRAAVGVVAPALGIALVSVALPKISSDSQRYSASTFRLAHRWAAFLLGGAAWVGHMVS